MKLDMSQAYDEVEWRFLKKAMLKMGFDIKWTELIQRCIPSSTFSVLFNRAPQELFNPSRRLRQGCPLSPFLFIICAETLSAKLIQAK